MAEYTNVEDLFIDKYKEKFNLLLITATDIEKKMLHEMLQPLPGHSNILEINKSKYTYYVGVFGAFFCVHVNCNEMGSIGRNSSIVTAVDAIETWKPTVVLMVGIAFGANKKTQEIGDVLVCERIIPYDPKRIGKNAVINRGKQGPASSVLFDRFKSQTSWEHPLQNRNAKLITGEILSGETLLDNKEIKKAFLADNPEAIGGEMEGAGIYAACDQRVKDWIIVKGICDWADGHKKNNKNLNQKTAITSALSISQLVFSKPHSFKDIGLVANQDELSLDFAEEKGEIPMWMKNKERSLAKEIRNEN